MKNILFKVTLFTYIFANSLQAIRPVGVGVNHELHGIEKQRQLDADQEQCKTKLLLVMTTEKDHGSISYKKFKEEM